MIRAMRDAVGWLLFPAALCAVLGGAALALGQGAAPSAVAGVGALASLAVVAAF
jgi:hypothetical protein